MNSTHFQLEDFFISQLNAYLAIKEQALIQSITHTDEESSYSRSEQFIEEFVSFAAKLFQKVVLYNSNQLISDLIKDHFIYDIALIRSKNTSTSDPRPELNSPMKLFLHSNFSKCSQLRMQLVSRMLCLKYHYDQLTCSDRIPQNALLIGQYSKDFATIVNYFKILIKSYNYEEFICRLATRLLANNPSLNFHFFFKNLAKQNYLSDKIQEQIESAFSVAQLEQSNKRPADPVPGNDATNNSFLNQVSSFSNSNVNESQLQEATTELNKRRKIKRVREKDYIVSLPDKQLNFDSYMKKSSNSNNLQERTDHDLSGRTAQQKQEQTPLNNAIGSANPNSSNNACMASNFLDPNQSRQAINEKSLPGPGAQFAAQDPNELSRGFSSCIISNEVSNGLHCLQSRQELSPKNLNKNSFKHLDKQINQCGPLNFNKGRQSSIYTFSFQGQLAAKSCLNPNPNQSMISNPTAQSISNTARTLHGSTHVFFKNFNVRKSEGAHQQQRRHHNGQGNLKNNGKRQSDKEDVFTKQFGSKQFNEDLYNKLLQQQMRQQTTEQQATVQQDYLRAKPEQFQFCRMVPQRKYMDSIVDQGKLMREPLNDNPAKSYCRKRSEMFDLNSPQSNDWIFPINKNGILVNETPQKQKMLSDDEDDGNESEKRLADYWIQHKVDKVNVPLISQEEC